MKKWYHVELEFLLLLAMSQRVAVLILSMVSAVAADSAPVSGRVEIREKGNVKRAVVREVLVYLSGARAELPEALRNRPVSIASRNKTFSPHVEVIPIHGSVSFPNEDDIMHNVFSLSKGNKFDLGLYKNGAKKDFTFSQPGLVRIYCNIHPQMSAFLQVVENPYFAWATADGGFIIGDVPPGSYQLNAWHEEGEASQPLVVTESGASGLVLPIDVSGYAKRPHLNKFGKPYKREKY
jgi:plastocyanin